MARRLSLPAMGRPDGAFDGAPPRCAVGWNASPAMSPTCTEDPRRARGPSTVNHRSLQPMPAGSHSLQIMDPADPFSLARLWSTTKVISDFHGSLRPARWMPADFQWYRARTLVRLCRRSAARQNALNELDALHASDHYDRMRGACRGQRRGEGCWEWDGGSWDGISLLRSALRVTPAGTHRSSQIA